MPTWFDTFTNARYRGVAPDSMLATAVRLKLITQDEADIIKLIPNGGFRLEASTPPIPAAVEAAPEA